MTAPDERVFVVTGTGHSGTGWAARFFTALGYPCGHERHLRYSPFTGPLPSAESSWMAAAHLHALHGVPIVHLLRDPLATVRSFLRTGTYHDPDTDSPHTQFTYCLPGMHDTDELGRCILRTTMWDAAVHAHPMALRVRIEDMHPGRDGAADEAAAMVACATGTCPPHETVQQTLKDLGTDLNPHARHADADVTWADVLAHPLGYLLVERARTYGYEVTA